MRSIGFLYERFLFTAIYCTLEKYREGRLTYDFHDHNNINICSSKMYGMFENFPSRAKAGVLGLKRQLVVVIVLFFDTIYVKAINLIVCI